MTNLRFHMFDRSPAAAERAVELNGGGSLPHLSLDESVVAFEDAELRAQNVLEGVGSALV